MTETKRGSLLPLRALSLLLDGHTSTVRHTCAGVGCPVSAALWVVQSRTDLCEAGLGARGVGGNLNLGTLSLHTP